MHFSPVVLLLHLICHQESCEVWGYRVKARHVDNLDALLLRFFVKLACHALYPRRLPWEKIQILSSLFGYLYNSNPNEEWHSEIVQGTRVLLQQDLHSQVFLQYPIQWYKLPSLVSAYKLTVTFPLEMAWIQFASAQGIQLCQEYGRKSWGCFCSEAYQWCRNNLFQYLRMPLPLVFLIPCKDPLWPAHIWLCLPDVPMKMGQISQLWWEGRPARQCKAFNPLLKRWRNFPQRL